MPAAKPPEFRRGLTRSWRLTALGGGPAPRPGASPSRVCGTGWRRPSGMRDVRRARTVRCAMRQPTPRRLVRPRRPNAALPASLADADTRPASTTVQLTALPQARQSALAVGRRDLSTGSPSIRCTRQQARQGVTGREALLRPDLPRGSAHRPRTRRGQRPTGTARGTASAPARVQHRADQGVLGGPHGFVTVYTPRLTFLTARGVTADFIVATGFITLRTLRGLALRTLLRTTHFGKPTRSSSDDDTVMLPRDPSSGASSLVPRPPVVPASTVEACSAARREVLSLILICQGAVVRRVVAP